MPVPCKARHGHSRGPQYFLAEEMLGWVSRGWSESRTRPANLTTLVPRRGEKSPQPVYAPQGCRLQQKRKNNALSGGPPHAQKLQQRAKKRRRASPCGGGRRAEPGLRTSRHLCPEGVKRARGRSRKKPPPQGPPRHKKKACQGSTLPVLEKSEKFSFVQKRPPRVVG